MSNLEKSIVKVLQESRGIYENHAWLKTSPGEVFNHKEVVKTLNSSAKDFAGETPNFVHGKGPNKNGPDNGTHDTPKHSSPVKGYYHHQGKAGPSVTVSHHEDGSATVMVKTRHKETHHKTLIDAIDHVGKLEN